MHVTNGIFCVKSIIITFFRHHPDQFGPEYPGNSTSHDGPLMSRFDSSQGGFLLVVGSRWMLGSVRDVFSWWGISEKSEKFLKSQSKVPKNDQKAWKYATKGNESKWRAQSKWSFVLPILQKKKEDKIQNLSDKLKYVLYYLSIKRVKPKKS